MGSFLGLATSWLQDLGELLLSSGLSSCVLYFTGRDNLRSVC